MQVDRWHPEVTALGEGRRARRGVQDIEPCTAAASAQEAARLLVGIDRPGTRGCEYAHVGEPQQGAEDGDGLAPTAEPGAREQPDRRQRSAGPQGRPAASARGWRGWCHASASSVWLGRGSHIAASTRRGALSVHRVAFGSLQRSGARPQQGLTLVLATTSRATSAWAGPRDSVARWGERTGCAAARHARWLP